MSLLVAALLLAIKAAVPHQAFGQLADPAEAVAPGAADPCWLGEVPVSRCDERAQLYRPALEVIPPRHWALVREVVIWDRPGGWACEASDPESPELCADRVGAVLLPGDRYASAHVRHEVGHLVGDNNDGELIRAWQIVVWADGVLDGNSASGRVERLWERRRGRPVSTDPAGWQSEDWAVIREDFAESYSRVLLGDLERMPDERRTRFVREKVLAPTVGTLFERQ